jgi:DNA-directed RNA polymerase subunit RPC12/RpoP
MLCACGTEFTPDKRASRLNCPGCSAELKAQRKKRSVAKRSQLRKEGKWREHLRLVEGLGTGNAWKTHSGVFRICLDCSKEFEVPIDTDWRICPGCHTKHARLLDECEDEALGISDSSIFSGSLGNGGRREPCRKAA